MPRPYEWHGETNARLHHIWKAMKCRCNSKSDQRYGGRGIRVCDEWRRSYIAFRDWAKANGYSDELEIDRINVNAGYEPGNCRWVTRAQQMGNIRKRCDGITSVFKGVCRARGRWRAQIAMHGRTNHIGMFSRELAAALAYDDAAHCHHGEFAFLNFPERYRCASEPPHRRIKD